MTEYVATYLSVGLEEALVVQKRYFRDFGTTMRGMMSHHGMDPAPFLEFVHTIDLGDMAPSPSLDAALGRLPGRKLIFTNASAAHAGRVMERLGVSHHFEYVFDIADAEYAPKPEPMVYDKLVERHGLDPAEDSDDRRHCAQFGARRGARHDHGLVASGTAAASRRSGLRLCRSRRR